MTSKQIYDAVNTEMNKVEAPSMLLEDFNYFINKAIILYINKKYNLYDINQQSTDDLRVLKSTAIITPKNYNIDDRQYKDNFYGENNFNNEFSLYGGVVEFDLPSDYVHMLNCICNFKVMKNYKCYNANDQVQFAARRLTSDMWSQVINNFYMRPSYKRPYYFIHNVNTSSEIPTNPISSGGTDPDSTYDVPYRTNVYNTENGFDCDVYLDYLGYTYYLDSSFIVWCKLSENGTELNAVGNREEATKVNIQPRSITFGNSYVSLIERPAEIRYGNSSPVRLEIRYGKDRTLFVLDKIYVDYIKAPQHIRLTQEQLDLTEDTSQMLEFPDYVCYEIINELVKLIMENASDPRLLTNIPVNLTIATPAQQGR